MRVHFQLLYMDCASVTAEHKALLNNFNADLLYRL